MAKSDQTGLQRDAVGLMSVLFISVTNMAPGAAVAFSILFAAPYASSPRRRRPSASRPSGPA